MIKKIFSNSHTWTIIGAFVVGGLTYIDKFLPTVVGVPLLGILGIVAIALNINQGTSA